MKPLSDNMRGATLMMASMASFVLGDGCVKALGASLPLSQIITIRGVVAVLFILALARMLGQFTLRWPRRDGWLIAARSAAEVGATFFFLTALVHMPIANLGALMQLLPLTVTLGAAVFFREAVGWRRWLAIAVGFAGMLMIVRPGGDGFDIWSVSGLIAVLCVTVRDLVVRRMSAELPSLMVTLAAALSVLVFASIWSFWQDWQPVDAPAALLLVAASVFIVAGYSFSVMVMRVGDLSFSAPFRYTALIWSIAIGVLAFGERPSALTLIGAALIVSTGLFTLWRENVTRRKPA